MRKLLLLVTVCAAIAGPVVGASAAASATATAKPTAEARLAAIALTASDVRLPKVDGHRGLTEPTNTYCNEGDASDRLRLARVQDWFETSNGMFRTSARVSIEVVLYRSGGAAAALAEIASVPSRCGSGRVSYRSWVWSTARAPNGSLPGSVALSYDAVTYDGYRLHETIVAQRHGAVVSILYVLDYDEFGFDPLVKRLVQVEASRLRALATKAA